MQVAPSGGQICNLCKWRHLVAKFATNVSGAMLLPSLIQITESISGSVVPLAMFWICLHFVVIVLLFLRLLLLLMSFWFVLCRVNSSYIHFWLTTPRYNCTSQQSQVTFEKEGRQGKILKQSIKHRIHRNPKLLVFSKYSSDLIHIWKWIVFLKIFLSDLICPMRAFIHLALCDYRHEHRLVVSSRIPSIHPSITHVGLIVPTAPKCD